ncbi:MAG: 4'-phosphopantetheinyl transferase superfamily protein [Legionellaceae bacterium]|nr:4'-phosphopantetheinyl transferase superfamily protein [Legionellaceae bacterium]
MFSSVKHIPSSTCFKFTHLDIEACSLLQNRVDIWQYPLHTLWHEALDLLSKSEVERAQRYYFDRHRRRFIVARATLRLILSRYIENTTPKDLEFVENEYGKPQLAHYPYLHFNISHSADLALLAIGKDYPVGIDLEFFSARPYAGIGSQMFSTTENQAFQQLAKHIQPLSFFHIWAQKEAFIKACGLGLSYPTQQFDVPHLPVTDLKIQDNLHNKRWHMVSFMPKVACSAAVCYHPQINEVRYISIENNYDLTQ